MFRAMSITVINDTIRGEKRSINGVSQCRNGRFSEAILKKSGVSLESGSCSKRSSKFSPQWGQSTSVAKQAVPQLGQMSSLGVPKVELM